MSLDFIVNIQRKGCKIFNRNYEKHLVLVVSACRLLFAIADRRFCMPEMKYMIAPAMPPLRLLQLLNSLAIQAVGV